MAEPMSVRRSADGVHVVATWSGPAWDDLPRNTREAVRRSMDAVCDILALHSDADPSDCHTWLPSKGHTPPRMFCLCSDPDYCLTGMDAATREAAIAYRREHGAPLPKGAK